MSKKKAVNSVEVDESLLNDSILSTSEMFEEDDICREIINGCSNSAINIVDDKAKDAAVRKSVATDILNGFIYFGNWCYMNQDKGEPDMKGWTQERVPQRIVSDSFCSHHIPIRKIIQKKKEIFEIKANSKTNSVRSGQSNRSKISRASLRSKLKKNPMDLELKKPLKNIMDENSEEDQLKVEIIQLNNNQNKNICKQSGKTKNNKTKRRLSKSMYTDTDKENNSNALSINLNIKNKANKYNRQSMNIGLKTTRLSMNSSNAYKYHPNKPFTFDHTGQKMSVMHMKPEKIPNNIVTPLISFEDNVLNEIDIQKDKKLKSKSKGKGTNLSRKNRKKSMSKNCKLKSKNEAIFKTNSVPIQPPIESIIKVEGGVSLKTQNATIKGVEKKKNTIENLSRSEYNKYIETLKHLTKTHVFDTTKNNNNHNNNDENRESDLKNDDTQKPQINPVMNMVGSSSPKSHRSPIALNRLQRLKINKNTQSIKYKRGLMSQQTDRLISPHNKNALGAALDFKSTFKANSNNNNHTKNNKYQRKFIVKSPTSKIQKSKLGKALFGSK